MSHLQSSTFGRVDYQADEPFRLIAGLAGFPGEEMFLPVQIPEQFPLLYLQSVLTPSLCFVALPVTSIDPHYELSTAEELASIGLSADTQPGKNLLCLALVCFDENGGAAANLRAPILVNTTTRVAVQAVRSDDRYPIRHPLGASKEESSC